MTPQNTNIPELVVNDMTSEAQLTQLENAGQLQPNQIYTTPDEVAERGKSTVLINNQIVDTFNADTKVDKTSFQFIEPNTLRITIS